MEADSSGLVWSGNTRCVLATAVVRLEGPDTDHLKQTPVFHPAPRETTLLAIWLLSGMGPPRDKQLFYLVAGQSRSAAL